MSFHGGMEFLPLRTELKNRTRSSCGNLRRSNEPLPGLTMRGPWQWEQMCLKTSEPSWNCACDGGSSGVLSGHTGDDRAKSDAAATTQAVSLIQNSEQKQQEAPWKPRGASITHAYFASANIHSEPPAGTLASRSSPANR